MPVNIHPKGLPYLFLTELWERFGFYIVQGMLVLYMTKFFGFNDDDSYAITGVFSALAYSTPMLGGLVADKLLGFKASITWGGIFLFIGYTMLALPWPHLFYVALATIIVGTGLFKPNISSLLGALYQPSDPNRDAGFTIFYIGINLGILLAGIISGVLKNYFGWYASFTAASMGLLIGLSAFAAGLKWGSMKYKSHHIAVKNFWLSKPLLIFYCLITILLISFLLQSKSLTTWLLPTFGILLLFFIFYLAVSQEKTYRNRLLLLNMLVIAAVLFWTIHLQMFFSTTLYIDRLIDKQVFGINIPTASFYTLEGFFIILLGSIFAWLWQFLNQYNKNPSLLTKFALGIMFAGIGCLILSISTYFHGENYLVNPLWIILFYLMITIGEILVSPIGLSAITSLSPPHLTGMMMGIWFVALGFGGQFAGILAKFASIPESAINQPLIQLAIYHRAFLTFALIAFAITTALLVLQYFLKNLLSNRID